MIVLARAAGEGRRKIRQIARTMDIPEGYLPQVMTPLVQGGLISAAAGRSGGYELARPANEITLLEVIERTAGPLTEEHCLLAGGPCDWEQVCPLHEFWVRTHSALRHELECTTFDQLAARDRAIEAGTFDATGLIPHPRSVERRGRRDASL
jgi:cysteine desulfurase